MKTLAEWLDRKKPKPKAKRRIKAVSPKREKINREYAKLRASFLKEHPYCEWWIAESRIGPYSKGNKVWQFVPPSTDIHHKKGRGKYLLDTSTWMAVCRYGHEAIHADPKTSYEKGYMIQRR